VAASFFSSGGETSHCTKKCNAFPAEPYLSPPVTADSLSPYLFGTNLLLRDGNDQVLTSDEIQANMQFIHVRIVRLILQPGLSASTLLQAAQVIKGINALPLVDLEGMQHPDTALADDLQAAQVMNQVFAKKLVYYEFGNEDDNNGDDLPDALSPDDRSPGF
jgi:hypothetical protein